jgi:hypothetical protein
MQHLGTAAIIGLSLAGRTLASSDGVRPYFDFGLSRPSRNVRLLARTGSAGLMFGVEQESKQFLSRLHVELIERDLILSSCEPLHLGADQLDQRGVRHLPPHARPFCRKRPVRGFVPVASL